MSMAQRVTLIAWGMLCWQGAVAAPDQDPLPEVNVIGRRAPRPTAYSPASNVQVITSDDIAKSTASDVSSLLATEANLSVQNFFGNDKKTTVDMRGMGGTAASNVLILVDGERLNETDLSGADLSTLSLSQIDSIEVIRGGGGVRFGQGAVGGVINIITKRPDAGPLQADFVLRHGSYNARTEQAGVQGGSGRFAAQALLSHSRTEGYRDNGGLESNNINLEARLVPTSDHGLVDLYARAHFLNDSYGMPGPVSREAFQANDASRRATQFPLDGGSTSDQRMTVGGAYGWGPGGKLSWRLSHRDRSNPYRIGASNFTLDVSRGLINAERTDGQLRYDLSHTSQGKTQALSVGLDAQDGRYARYDGGVALDGGTRISGQAKTRAVFVDTSTSPLRGLNIHAGARQDWFTTGEAHEVYETCYFVVSQKICRPQTAPVLDTNRPDVPSRQWRNTSAELGASWALAPRWTVFGSLNQHVRYPNLDELALQDDNLRPQQGYTVEHGLRFAAPRWSWSITAFAMRIEDEIYYGKDAFGNSLNRNYEHPTLRQGLELEARWRPSERWLLSGQWAHVRPKFEHQPGDPDIPLVPRNTLSGKVTSDILPHLQWTLQASHGSQRLDGNALDDASTHTPPIGSNTLVNTALRLHRKAWQLSLGVNNVLDKVYVTEAYSGTVYPMPGRTWYAEWRMQH